MLKINQIEGRIFKVEARIREAKKTRKHGSISKFKIRKC